MPSGTIQPRRAAVENRRGEPGTLRAAASRTSLTSRAGPAKSSRSASKGRRTQSGVPWPVTTRAKIASPKAAKQVASSPVASRAGKRLATSRIEAPQSASRDAKTRFAATTATARLAMKIGSDSPIDCPQNSQSPSPTNARVTASRPIHLRGTSGRVVGIESDKSVMGAAPAVPMWQVVSEATLAGGCAGRPRAPRSRRGHSVQDLRSPERSTRRPERSSGLPPCFVYASVPRRPRILHSGSASFC